MESYHLKQEGANEPRFHYNINHVIIPCGTILTIKRNMYKQAQQPFDSNRITNLVSVKRSVSKTWQIVSADTNVRKT